MVREIVGSLWYLKSRLVTSLHYGKSECEHYAVGRLVDVKVVVGN
jgi:hypothetical protein